MHAAPDDAAKEANFADASVDRFFLCGCSPYMFLEDTVSMYIHPLTPEGYKLERSEQLQDQWGMLFTTVLMPKENG